MISLAKGKYIIGSLWFFGFLTLFVIMTAQTVGGEIYGDRNKEAWEWLTPHLLPTIGLILGVIIADWQNAQPIKGLKVSYALIIVTFILSLTHLLILLIVVFIAGNKQTVNDTFNSLTSANLPLGVLQGLVALTLGIFFKK